MLRHDIIPGSKFAFLSEEIADRHTNTQTHGTDFIPSTAEVGGNKKLTVTYCASYYNYIFYLFVN